MKRTNLGRAACLALVLLGACREKTDAPKPRPSPSGRFTIIPTPMPSDPALRKKAQSDLVQIMIDDPAVSLDVIEGEAYRRGVTLTDAQRAAKRAQKPDTPNGEQAPTNAN